MVSLIEVESCLCAVKSDLFADSLFVVGGTGLVFPILLALRVIPLTSYLILHAKLILIGQNYFIVVGLSHKFLSWHALRGEQTHFGIFLLEVKIKAVCC